MRRGRPDGGSHAAGRPRPDGPGRPPRGPGFAGGDRTASVPRSRPRDGSFPGGDSERGRRRPDGGRPGPAQHPPLDVRVSFLPNRDRLALVVRDIQASRRAFPLVEIARRFLGRDDSYLIKLEFPMPAEGAERERFIQCQECRRVFRVRGHAESHVLDEHLDTFFVVEESEVEPPAGTFTCVARCGLSGTLLGPPNYHGYNEMIQSLWASRFAHMSKAEYLGHVETLRDEAMVEQWKESVRKKIRYRLKDHPEGGEPAAQTRAEAQEWLRGRLGQMLRESSRCTVPGPQSRKFDDQSLRAAVSLAWQKENRFPLTLLLALRPAFRHMHLHLFKVNARETYVSAIAPAPLDLETAPEIVREIMAFLEEHPGIPRQAVLEELRAGADPESSEASELLLHLGNLIATGGVMELFNGTLILPRSGMRPSEPASGNAKGPLAAMPPGPAADASDFDVDTPMTGEASPENNLPPEAQAPGGEQPLETESMPAAKREGLAQPEAETEPSGESGDLLPALEEHGSADATETGLEKAE